jgi:hypothetical protein
MLVAFASAVDAATCVMEVQKSNEHFVLMAAVRDQSYTSKKLGPTQSRT